ncbi:MAG TPA: minor capsid protein, partial [Pyrinomonadaceae bacterium]
MLSLFKQAKALQKELIRLDAAAAEDLVQAYGEAYRRIQVQLDELKKEMADARLRGDAITVAWLMRRDRLATLLRLVEYHINSFSTYAEDVITRTQSDAVEMAQDHVLKLAGIGLVIAAGLMRFPRPAQALARLPQFAVQDLAGRAADGAPLKRLLDSLSQLAQVRVRRVVISSISLEQTPQQLSVRVREALGQELTHALTIARTEQVNAYRESARRLFEANREGITGWVWMSALTERTCALCWAMHGTVHKVTETLDSHPNCRCIAVPIMRGAEAAFDTGVNLFDELT